MTNFFRSVTGLLFLAALLMPILSVAAEAPDDAQCTFRARVLCPIQDRPGLPRVLLIGDSVSMGYTLPVRRLLAGIANVHRIPRNGGSTRIGLRFLDQWLGNGKWDVIHVNFGAHDDYLTRNGSAAVGLDEYARNVRTILTRLKATGAHVIWATSTPIPAHIKPPAHQFGDITAYNRVALSVAHEEGVAIDDLYAVMKPREAELQRPENPHFNKLGDEVLGQAVAKSIRQQLRPQ